MSAYEVNFDGLVGLTHNYAGLSFGNVASTSNKNAASNPQLAALQGLSKMKALHDMGFLQGILPPQERPCMATLRELGFSGRDEQILAKVAKQAPQLLANVSSASSMWVANAATVSPSADTADNKVHFTVANLNNKFHRSIEATTTRRALQAVFSSAEHFVHHAALPQQALFGDEGAANHNRLCRDYTAHGVELFVYGRQAWGGAVEPQRFPARQTREASEAVARLHQLNAAQRVFIQQNPAVIDQGVFHNDVIAVSNGPVLFHHQQAFLDQARAFAELEQKLNALDSPFIPIEVPTELVAVQDAVDSYLFNSQLLTKANGKMLIVVPEESRQNPRVWAYLQQLISSGGPIDEVKVFDLRESMCNGGGPACLRLRVVLNASELKATNSRCLMDDQRFETLNQWVKKHYRDRLLEADLADPQLLIENRTALDELTQIMGLGSLYPFQQA
ncbi:N-succinylarginine dihydrolase [Vibrio metschnikovii]|nr:N-succinylarginine dihydrolase [Vibrio metschnikovii]EKO3688855.1 N-succinylarginine dihydrolase [Vibrio metschnikovii]EKO3781623.1 N-succinylarginine dihydrolase [Vibrio metschnikovii]EKO3885853.1 N-succinylarginine dihydrolase [Vibrio metschnikovii]EKO3889732.1 N-succinylarginine dihydrolase [Vibrio metschnikovii]